MARVTLTAVERFEPATPTLNAFTDLDDDTGGEYAVKSEGNMLFLFWNNGTTGSATITIDSVAVPGWLNRTGDITQAMAVDTMYSVIIPPTGFSDNGYINFAVSGTGADDVDVLIVKNI
jgi:hypothetical protein